MNPFSPVPEFPCVSIREIAALCDDPDQRHKFEASLQNAVVTGDIKSISQYADRLGPHAVIERQELQRWLHKRGIMPGELPPKLGLWVFPERPPAEAPTAKPRTPSDMRTAAAIATRKDNKNDRRKKLKLFIDGVYTALDMDGYALVDNGRRKPLPVSKASLRTAFIDRHPEHKISLATFNDDLPQISVKVNPGRKRFTVKYLKTILAKNNHA